MEKSMEELQALYRRFRESSGISTDTRKITEQSIFFALTGENFNANEFAQQALEKGAKYAVVDEERYAVNERCILVDNVLRTLQKLARFHRDQFTIPVLGLTGSNGKTTSKELVSAVLSRKYRTHATRGNLNNHIGVPLTILSMEPSAEIAVIEMGANHVGEIADLCAIANPTHGFITNIGKAHVGTFGGFENIIRAKSELYQHLISTNGQVFINSRDAILSNMAKRFKAPLFYPAKGDYYHVDMLSADPFVRIKTESGDEVQTQLIGSYNFDNVAAALCIGKFFKVPAGAANQAIADYVPGNMRSQVVVKGSNTIILDAYNANPSSMQAAIENLAAMKAPRKILILGDMFELEGESAGEHRNLGKLIATKNFSGVYFCGNLIQVAKEEYSRGIYFQKKEELIEELKKSPIENATILVKASRGIGLETILDYL